MNHEFQRYSCQVALPGFGEAAQQKLQQAKVLIAGAGGLGCPAAQYLVAAGIGTLCIADDDIISLSNLHRQILYAPAETGLKKVTVAAKKLRLQNPGISVVAYDEKITSANVMELIKLYHIVVDATDNFETKYLLNDACVLSGKPLVYGAIYQYEGQVAVFNVVNENLSLSPNYRDLFPEVNAAQIPNCAEGGVLPTLSGIIGCMQANEVIKYLTNTGELLAGKLLVFDAMTLQSRVIKIGVQTKTNIKSLTQTIQFPALSKNDLKQGLEQDSYVLVDVRTAEERENFNIGGVHIPLSNIKEVLPYLNSDKPVVFYCASGARSGEAVKTIKRLHPSANVFSLNGGIKAWEE